MQACDSGFKPIRQTGIALLLLLSIFCRSSFAAELAQATAVYGVIATDPLYLWIAQEKGLFKKNGVNIGLTTFRPIRRCRRWSAAKSISSDTPKAKTARWDQFVDERFIKEAVGAGPFK